MQEEQAETLSLKGLRARLANIRFMDPACGCGIIV